MVDFKSLSILVIDDNQYIRDLVKSVLRGFGVGKIYEAAHGAAGYRLCAEQRVDIVLCDIEMKPVNGIQFVQYVRSGKAPPGFPGETLPSRRLPIVMLTSHAKRALVDAAKEAGVNGFLVKPINPKVLRDRITKIAEYLQALAD